MVAEKQNTHLNLNVHIQNYEYMHKLITDDYVDCSSEPQRLVTIMEAALDFGMIRLADDVKEDIMKHFPLFWREHKAKNHSDMSGASDQDNR
jgi:hypothetical protein